MENGHWKRGRTMKSLLIKDTTREERQQIVDEALGNIDGMCDGCSRGLIDMYDKYIDGEMELSEVNKAFRTGYVSGMETPPRPGCENIQYQTDNYEPDLDLF